MVRSVPPADHERRVCDPVYRKKVFSTRACRWCPDTFSIGVIKALSGQLSSRHNVRMTRRRFRYLRHRFPPDIISHPVWPLPPILPELSGCRGSDHAARGTTRC